MDLLFEYLISVFAWGYKIAAFLILAIIPIRLLIKVVSGNSKGSFV